MYLPQSIYHLWVFIDMAPYRSYQQWQQQRQPHQRQDLIRSSSKQQQLQHILARTGFTSSSSNDSSNSGCRWDFCFLCSYTILEGCHFLAAPPVLVCQLGIMLYFLYVQQLQLKSKNYHIENLATYTA